MSKAAKEVCMINELDMNSAMAIDMMIGAARNMDTMARAEKMMLRASRVSQCGIEVPGGRPDARASRVGQCGIEVPRGQAFNLSK